MKHNREDEQVAQQDRERLLRERAEAQRGRAEDARQLGQESHQQGPEERQQQAPPQPRVLGCPDCGHEVSRQADSCPNCGHVFRRAMSPGRSCFNWAAGCLLVILVLWLLAMASWWPKQETNSANTTTPYRQQIRTRQPEPRQVRTMAQNLLIIDGGGPVPPGDPRLVPYEEMLDLLATRTTSTRQQVGDGTASLKRILKNKHGIDMSCLDLMYYVANTIPMDGSLKWTYAEFAAVWMTLFLKSERR